MKYRLKSCILDDMVKNSLRTVNEKELFKYFRLTAKIDQNSTELDRMLVSIACRRKWLPERTAAYPNDMMLRNALRVHKEYYEGDGYVYCYDDGTHPLKMLRKGTKDFKLAPRDVMGLLFHRFVRPPKGNEIKRNPKIDRYIQELKDTRLERAIEYAKLMKWMSEHPRNWDRPVHSVRHAVKSTAAQKDKRVYCMIDETGARNQQYVKYDGSLNMGISCLGWNACKYAWNNAPMVDIMNSIGPKLGIKPRWKYSNENMRVTSWRSVGNVMWVNNLHTHSRYESVCSLLKKHNDRVVFIIVTTAQRNILTIWDKYILDRQELNTYDKNGRVHRRGRTDYVYVRFDTHNGKLMNYSEYRSWVLENQHPKYADKFIKKAQIIDGEYKLSFNATEIKYIPLLAKSEPVFDPDKDKLPSECVGMDFFKNGLKLIGLLERDYGYQSTLVYRESFEAKFQYEKHTDIVIEASPYSDARVVPYEKRHHENDAVRGFVHAAYTNKKTAPMFRDEVAEIICETEEYYREIAKLVEDGHPGLFTGTGVRCECCGRPMRMIFDVEDVLKNTFGILDATDTIEYLEEQAVEYCIDWTLTDPVLFCENCAKFRIYNETIGSGIERSYDMFLYSSNSNPDQPEWADDGNESDEYLGDKEITEEDTRMNNENLADDESEEDESEANED